MKKKYQTSNQDLYDEYRKKLNGSTIPNQQEQLNALKTYADTERAVNNQFAGYQKQLDTSKTTARQNTMALQDIVNKYLPNRQLRTGTQGLGVAKTMAKNINTGFEDRLDSIDAQHKANSESIYQAYRDTLANNGLVESAINNRAGIQNAIYTNILQNVEGMELDNVSKDKIYSYLLQFEGEDFGENASNYRNLMAKYVESKKVEASANRGRESAWESLKRYAAARSQAIQGIGSGYKH